MRNQRMIGKRCANLHECTWEYPGRGEGLALVLAASLVATGGVYLAMDTPNQTEHRHTESSSERGPCLTKEDFQTLELAIRVGPGKLLPIELGRDGSARVKLGSIGDLPRDQDLPIAVVTVPPGAVRLLKRGQVVGRVRVASVAPARDAEAAGTPSSGSTSN